MREDDPQVVELAYDMVHAALQRFGHGDPMTQDEWAIVGTAAMMLLVNTIVRMDGDPALAQQVGDRIRRGVIELQMGEWTGKSRP